MCAVILAALVMLMPDGRVVDAQDGPLAKVDHLVYAAPDLQAGDRPYRAVVRRAGDARRSASRRRHTQCARWAGTRHVSGDHRPDPDQPAPRQPRTFGIDALTAPRLVTWAAKSGSLEDLVRDAQTHGITFGAVGSGSRKTPQGTLLQWRYHQPASR